MPLFLPIEVETEGAVFEIYRRTVNRQGYPAVIRTQFITVPDEMYEEKIKEDIVEKAGKRVNWTAQHKSLLYIVALDVRDHRGIDEVILTNAMYGHSETFMHPLNPPPFATTKEIEEAKVRGWSSIMKKYGAIPNGQTTPVRGKEGVFVTNRICKNVSAVLVLSIRGLSLFPNPFSFSEINNRAIVDWIS